MSNVLALLRGKKTYFCATVALLYIVGSVLGFYECDDKVLVSLGFGGLIFLRSALAGFIATPEARQAVQGVREVFPKLSERERLDRMQSNDGSELIRSEHQRAWRLCFLCAAVLGIVSGCASFSTRQEDISYDEFTGAATRKIITRASARTFFDARSQLARFKATQTDKTQSAQVGEIGMETSGTNAVQVLDRIYKIVSALPK